MLMVFSTEIYSYQKANQVAVYWEQSIKLWNMIQKILQKLLNSVVLSQWLF